MDEKSILFTCEVPCSYERQIYAQISIGNRLPSCRTLAHVFLVTSQSRIPRARTSPDNERSSQHATVSKSDATSSLLEAPWRTLPLIELENPICCVRTTFLIIFSDVSHPALANRRCS